MKAFFDKYKYILGLGLALVVVVIIAVVSAAMGKDAAENSGISYVTPETSSFTTVESLVATTTFQTDSNSQTTPATTVTDTSSQTLPESEKPETTAITSVTSTSATAADISKPTEKPVFTSAPTSSASPASSKVTTVSTASSVISTTPKPDKPIKKYDNTCTILNNKDKLKKGLEKYIPDNAVIFSGTVGFDSGESVYDILRRICDENSIQMEASYTPAFSSYYVEGINNLYEFDWGQGSGWMYSVNGVFPNYGCSSYKPVNNDKIAFRYTCELGYDL